LFTDINQHLIDVLIKFPIFPKTYTLMAEMDIVSTLQRLIYGIDESIVIFDTNGTILHASDSLSRLLNVDELINRSIFDFIEGDIDHVKLWLENLSNAHFKDVKLKMCRNKLVFPARLRMAAWAVSKNEFIIMASIVDATFIERKKRDLLRKTLTIEQLSKSRKIRDGKLNDAIYEILEMSSKAVQVERVNAWLFNDDATLIECIGNYDASIPGLIEQDSLPRIQMPNYFRLFETEKIIVSSNSMDSEITRELRESYLVPNNIFAMMDIPLRIEGDIIGVICFEQIGHTRDWSLQDQKFGLIAAQMVSLSVETNRRKRIQYQLENALRQQKRLLFETNHRIKNNLAISTSLMRMQLDKCKDDFHRSLIQDAINRINSIAALHELLSDSKGVHRVDFEVYSSKLLQSIQASLSDPNKPIQLVYTIEQCEISSSLAITLGLIINEAVTNSYKHAFKEQSVGMIRVDLTIKGSIGRLIISDTGKGFEPTAKHGQGLEIIAGLAQHIEAEIKTTTDAGSTIELIFRLN